MNQINVAVAIFAASVVCWGLGLLAGYSLGRKQKMTKKEAASILAKAMHKARREGPVPCRGSFFGTVNK